jgi:hypothetical protein
VKREAKKQFNDLVIEDLVNERLGDCEIAETEQIGDW